MKSNVNLWIVALALVIGSAPAAAQKPVDNSEVEILPATVEGCRRTGIDIANLEAQVKTTKQRGFVIAHLGSGERSALINRRRLADVRFMFGDITSNEVVFAVGQRVRGQGRIEFYLGSELMNVTLFARNKGLCPLCCKR